MLLSDVNRTEFFRQEALTLQSYLLLVQINFRCSYNPIIQYIAWAETTHIVSPYLLFVMQLNQHFSVFCCCLKTYSASEATALQRYTNLIIIKRLTLR